MKVEIENVLEIKEDVIYSDGNIISKFPNYTGHVIKIVILNEKRQIKSTLVKEIEANKEVEEIMDPTRIEGYRYKRGQKKSRQSAKDFVRLISRKLDVKEKTPSWIILKNRNRIRISNSVVYDGVDGDYLWYSLSCNNLVEKMKEGNFILAFIIRDSKKIVYVNVNDIIQEIERASELRGNDWIHLHIIFLENIIKFHFKTGKDNQPIEKEVSREKHYINWDKFTEIMREN